MQVDDVVDVEGNSVILSLERKSVRPYRSQDEYLVAMKEDLAEWFNTLYATTVTVDDFFEELDTGTLLCQHANYVYRFVHENPALCDVINIGEVTYRSNVKPGTFQSRDNISNFIQWCRNLGIPDVLLFETNDLVLRSNERNVVLCLLEVARRGARYGVLAPVLVQMEEEIDAEISGVEPPPSRARPMPYRAPVDMMSLDEMVRDLLGRCTCPQTFPMHRIAEGKYQIGDSLTVIFVRILRYHVMVRIGGGWDTLENYLDRHDPCRCQAKGQHKTPRRGCSGTPQAKRRPNVSGGISSRTPSRAATPEPGGYEPPAGSYYINKSPRSDGAGPTARSLRTATGARRRLPQTPAGEPSERAVSRIPASRKPRETDKKTDRQSANQDMLSVHSQSARKSSIPSPARLHKHFSSNGDLTAERGGRQSPTPARPGSARLASRTQALGNRRGSVDPHAATRGRSHTGDESTSHGAKSGPFDANAVRRQLLKPTSQPEVVRGRHPSDSDVLLISRDSSGRHRIGCGNGNGNDSDASTNGSGKRLGSTRTMFNTQNILPDKPRAVTRSDDVDAMCLSGDELSVPRRKYRPPLVKSLSLSSSEGESTASRSSFTSPLSTSCDFNEYPDVAPPEDRALNDQMERLFEAYRLQELQRQVSNGDDSAPLSRASSTLSVQSEGPRRHLTGSVAHIERPSSAQGTYRDSSRSRVPMNARSRDSSRSRTAVDDIYSQHVRPAAERLARSRCRADAREQPSIGQRQRSHSRDSRAATPAQSYSARGSRDSSVSRTSRDSSVNRQSRNVNGNRPSRDSSINRGSQYVSVNRPSRDSSVNRQSLNVKVNRPSRESSVSKQSRNVSMNCPSRDSSVSTQSRNVIVNRPSRDSSVKRQPRNVSVSRPSRDSSVNRGARDPNNRPSRDSSVSRQSRDVRVSRPSRDSSISRRSRDSSVSRGSRDSSVNRRSRADVPSRQAAKPQRRRDSCDDFIDSSCQRSSAEPETVILSPEDGDKPCVTSSRPEDLPLETALAKPRRDKRSNSRTRIPMPVDVKRRLADQAATMSTLKRFDSGVDINNMSPTDSSLMGEDEAAMWNQNEAMTMANQPLSCQVDGRDEEYY